MTPLTATPVQAFEPARHASPASHGTRHLLNQLWTDFLAYATGQQDRAALLRLDDRLLADIGLTRHDVETLTLRRSPRR